jgi:lipoate-protein ligase A
VNVRLLIDEPADGAWNMAVDEALLESAAQENTATLRLYRWSQPTLSLGYFQAFAERRTHPPSMSCALVRRASGGGAILHHHELTYCFTAPVRDRLGRDVQQLYRAIHGSLVQALDRLGVPAELWAASAGAERQAEPFLCFQRRAEGDVVAGGFKIAGSAQRRRRMAVMQHGSILLTRSPFAPELLGIAELMTNLDEQRLACLWLETLARRLGLTLQSGVLTPREEALASSLAGAKYGGESWIFRK